MRLLSLRIYPVRLPAPKTGSSSQWALMPYLSTKGKQYADETQPKSPISTCCARTPSEHTVTPYPILNQTSKHQIMPIRVNQYSALQCTRIRDKSPDKSQSIMLYAWPSLRLLLAYNRNCTKMVPSSTTVPRDPISQGMVLMMYFLSWE